MFRALVLLSSLLLGQPSSTTARERDDVKSMPAVLHAEGSLHGFLVIRTLEGELLADGDLTQQVRGDRIESNLVFHFKDSSFYQETVVFSQRRTFRLLRYHLLQKGPSFKHAAEVSLDGMSGQLTVHYEKEDGEDKNLNERLQLPADTANGMLAILLKNISPTEQLTKLSMVLPAAKPRIVKLLISPEGEDSFMVGSISHKARRYVVKIEIGGVAGLVAPVVGKQPQDIRIWITTDNSPVFVKSEGPLYAGGPTWRVELAAPVWKSR
jgi:hypothetical protein